MQVHKLTPASRPSAASAAASVFLPRDSFVRVLNCGDGGSSSDSASPAQDPADAWLCTRREPEDETTASDETLAALVEAAAPRGRHVAYAAGAQPSIQARKLGN
jgi:hypothetical protein